MSYEFLNVSRINNDFLYNCVCRPQLTEQEIEEIKKLDIPIQMIDDLGYILLFFLKKKRQMLMK